MATNLGINEELLCKAQKIGGHRTKRETVDSALTEYVRKREQIKLFELAGTIDYYPDYDYKALRYRNEPKSLRRARR